MNAESSAEINIIDLMALEALRQSDANVYSIIFDNHKVFAPQPIMLQMALTAKQDVSGLCQKATDLVVVIRNEAKLPEQTINLLKLLFPDWARLISKNDTLNFSKIERITEDQMYDLPQFQRTVI